MLLTTYTRLVHLSFSGTLHLGLKIFNTQKRDSFFQYPCFSTLLQRYSTTAAAKPNHRLSANGTEAPKADESGMRRTLT